MIYLFWTPMVQIILMRILLMNRPLQRGAIQKVIKHLISIQLWMKQRKRFVN